MAHEDLLVPIMRVTDAVPTPPLSLIAVLKRPASASAEASAG